MRSSRGRCVFRLKLGGYFFCLPGDKILAVTLVLSVKREKTLH